MTVSVYKRDAPWLLLTFTLPTKRASQRVEVWRKLQRYGAVPLGNSGYLLPNNPVTRERFEWLAIAVRNYAGQASVVTVKSIDNLSTAQLIARFAEARSREYQQLIQELEQISSIPRHRRPLRRLSRIRTRLSKITEVDFFHSPLQKRVQKLLAQAEAPPGPGAGGKINPREYTGRVWVTRPCPGIDRSASAWLIRRFIDKKARFTFAREEREEEVPRQAVRFDMFHSGFGHRGEDCTFETLQKTFRVHERKVSVIGEIIHDADLLDEKFGRKEGLGIDGVLNGWGKKGMADSEMLERGIQLIEALYHAVSGK
jgi:hypothetical protein